MPDQSWMQENATSATPQIAKSPPITEVHDRDHGQERLDGS
jgi:hypothetical protein